MAHKKQTRVQIAEDAARAHNDLNILYAVIALMESSLLSTDCHKVEDQIVQICRAASQRCLYRYDDALAHLERLP